MGYLSGFESDIFPKGDLSERFIGGEYLKGSELFSKTGCLPFSLLIFNSVENNLC